MHRLFGCLGNQLVAFGATIALFASAPLAIALWLTGASTVPVVLALVVAAIGAGVLIAWRLGRSIAQPIETLRDALSLHDRSPGTFGSAVVDRRDEVGQLASAFNALFDRLATQARAHEAFIADLAHELKNPIATVRACAERMDGAEGTAASQAVVARALGDSSRRLQTLVAQFLELARVEAGLPAEVREEVELTALLHGLLEGGLRARFPAVRFELSTPTGPAPVEGVPARLESALRNLLDNAGSFSGSGEVVEVIVERREAEALVRVSDRGPGIAPELLPRVFDRFFTTRGDDRGTGLGLAMSRAIVEAHHGSIRVESAPGRGATFVVQLPVRRA